MGKRHLIWIFLLYCLNTRKSYGLGLTQIQVQASLFIWNAQKVPYFARISISSSSKWEQRWDSTNRFVSLNSWKHDGQNDMPLLHCVAPDSQSTHGSYWRLSHFGSSLSPRGVSDAHPCHKCLSIFCCGSSVVLSTGMRKRRGQIRWHTGSETFKSEGMKRRRLNHSILQRRATHRSFAVT